MKRRSTSSDPRGPRLARQRVAAEAARLLALRGGDLSEARRKAAAKLGVRDPASLPGREDILEALHAHQRLFGGAGTDRLARLRRAALEAMEFFSAFDPRLAGPVLDGSAGTDDPVQLHLHADDPDAVARLLADRGAPAGQSTRRLRLAGGETATLPCWELLADGLPFELWVLPAQAARHPPRDPLG
ncbi:hypothetical protein, partial [Arenimonas sp.]|uniref:hypothetical protein n=1 Tax=Arenimonas sp. TaxID=1872635 RepID=UPI0025D93EF6